MLKLIGQAMGGRPIEGGQEVFRNALREAGVVEDEEVLVTDDEDARVAEDEEYGEAA